MLLAFEFFLVGEFFATRDDPILCLDMRGLRSGRFGADVCPCAAAKTAADAADLQAGRKTFEIALLFIAEVDGERFDFHVQRRSSCCHFRGSTGLDLAS